MEVTRSNFFELLPQIKEAITKASFITIDCELTGLNTGSEIKPYDTPKQYYEKVRRCSKNFLIIQYGLCIFRYDAEENAFKQCGYNFYIFPKFGNKFAPDHRFLCQASSIDFLASQGFDFNKLFKEGIPYLNVQEEEKYMTSLTEKQKQRADQLVSSGNSQNKISSTTIPEENAEFVENVFKQIQEFIASDEEELILPKCNGFIRRLIYQVAPERIGDAVSLETKQLENKDVVLCVSKMKKVTKEEREQKRIEEELQEFENSIGFSKILRHIVKSNKLVVGHNICLDLFHTIDKFVTPLPEDYDEFKDCAHTLFSKLLDTKYMSSTNEFKDLIDSSVLSHLFNTVQADPFELPNVEIENNYEGYNLQSKKEHEAGYDAFVTGICLLGMWNYLGKKQRKTDRCTFRDTSVLEPYMNKLFLMRLQDGPYIHLGGSDPSPSRDHVLYITFPKDWKANDLYQLFSPFGNIFISWIDDSSAYVSLYKKDQVVFALNALSKSKQVTVMTFAKRQAILEHDPYILTSPHPPARRKRHIEEPVILAKKRRTSSSGENKPKRSFDPIVEEAEENENGTVDDVTDDSIHKMCEVISSSVASGSANKTFEEDTDWD